MLKANRINILLDGFMFLVMAALILTPGTEAHVLFGILLMIGVITHLILHKRQIKILYTQLFPNPKTQFIGVILFILVTVSLFTLPFVLPREHHGPHGNQGGRAADVQED
jgi:uncharacterized membrane protein